MTSPREIYLDHAATTAPAPEVVAAMQAYLGDAFGNPSSVHRRGENARDALANARTQVAALAGALPEEVVFTATGSEANNLALKGLLANAAPERRRLVVSNIEHPSVLETARHLESRGMPVTVVPVEPNGVLDPARLAQALGPDVALVSVMWVNNEVGTIQPVAELAELAHRAGARFHCDAIQAAGKLPIDMTMTGIDLLSLAGHKFHGPPGAAALVVRRRLRLLPLVHGGHQERSRRAGTENLPAIVGLGVACELAMARLADAHAARGVVAGERLWRGLARVVPGCRLNGDPERRLGSIVNVRFPGVDGEAVLQGLDARGITVSTGSACSAAMPGPSPVLLALGLRAEDAHASVRFSAGDTTTDAEIDAVLVAVPEVIESLRGLGGNRPQIDVPEARARIAGSL